MKTTCLPTENVNETPVFISNFNSIGWDIKFAGTYLYTYVESDNLGESTESCAKTKLGCQEPGLKPTPLHSKANMPPHREEGFLPLLT